jgi:anti-anti-sigma factor
LLKAIPGIGAGEVTVSFTEEMLEGGLMKIALTGSLDAPGAMAIEDQFKERLKERGGNIILDMSGLDYMSSYGLRMILMSAKTLHDKGGGLYLAAPTSRVMEVIKVAGYDTMFPVYESVAEAILFLGD